MVRPEQSHILTNKDLACYLVVLSPGRVIFMNALILSLLFQPLKSQF